MIIIIIIIAKSIISIPHHSTHVLKIWPSHEMPEVETPLLALNRHKIQGKATNSRGSGPEHQESNTKTQIRIQIHIQTKAQMQLQIQILNIQGKATNSKGRWGLNQN